MGQHKCIICVHGTLTEDTISVWVVFGLCRIKFSVAKSILKFILSGRLSTCASEYNVKKNDSAISDSLAS